MLRLLFEKGDINSLKSYFQQQCIRILDGRSNYRDFMISREFKGFECYKSGTRLPILNLIEYIFYFLFYIETI